jgi:multidrug efflux pump subunit AcrA (membrane-fusion protein)
MKKPFYNLMMLIIILALGLSACANQQATPVQEDVPAASAISANTVVAEGHVKPVHAANLSFQARGIVESVNVEIGDRVSEGDVLARLSNASQAEAGLAAANLELLSAQQALDALVRTGDANLALAWTNYLNAQKVRAEAERAWERLDLDAIEDRIEDAQTEVKDREEDLKDAQDEFDRYKDLDEDNSRRRTAEDDLERAQEAYNEAVRKLEEITRERDAIRAALDAALASEAEAKYQWELSAAGVNKEQLTFAEARLENAQAQAAAAESALGNYILTAPFDGVVVDVAVSVGEQVGAESRAVAVADPSSWMIETTDVTELEVVDVSVGQAVTFTPDALPDVTMKGSVSAISQSSFTQSGDVIYTVYIEVDEMDPRLKWGMTVEVIFEVMD